MRRINTVAEKTRALLVDEWREAPLEIIDYIANQMPQDDWCGIYRKSDTPSGYWDGLMIEEGDVKSSATYYCKSLSNIRKRYKGLEIKDETSLLFYSDTPDDEKPYFLFLVDKHIFVFWAAGTETLPFCEVVLNGPAKIWVKPPYERRRCLISVNDGNLDLTVGIGEDFVCRSREKDAPTAVCQQPNLIGLGYVFEKIGYDLWIVRNNHHAEYVWIDTHSGRREFCVGRNESFTYKLVDDDLLTMLIGNDLHEVWFM